MGMAWALSGDLGIAEDLDGRWPACADELTPQMRLGLERLYARVRRGVAHPASSAAGPS